MAEQMHYDRTLIPVGLYPDINLIGLLIGHHGNTLKSIECQTGTKIVIQGRGVYNGGQIYMNTKISSNDEPAHALVTAKTSENVKKAIEMINGIIRKKIAKFHQLKEDAGIHVAVATNNGSGAYPVQPNSTLAAVCPNTDGVFETPTPVMATPNLDNLFKKRSMVAIFLAEMLEIGKASNIIFLVLTEILKLKRGEEEKSFCFLIYGNFVEPNAPLRLKCMETCSKHITSNMEPLHIKKKIFRAARLKVSVEIEIDLEEIGLLRGNYVHEYCRKFGCTESALPNLIIAFAIEKYTENTNLLNCLEKVREYFLLPQLKM